MFKKIIKNTTIVSGGILFSRILGVVRDIFIAKYFGTSKILEAFLVAFRLPNILRSLLGEGFSDSVATPVLSEYRNDKEKLIRIGGNLFSVFLPLLALVTIIGVLGAKFLVTGIAPGFIKDVDKFHLTVTFTRITFFYLFFIGLVAIINSILYASRQFVLPSFLPSLFNLSLICGIIFFVKYFKNYVLVMSVIGAGFLQFMVSFFYLRYKGMPIKINLGESFRDREILRMAKLFIPRIWASLVYQLNIFIDTIFASLTWIVGEGGLAAIYYANRIVQLPLALIGISISRVAIVDFSGFYKDNNLNDFKKLFVFSLQNILFFIIPIMFILLFLSKEILDVLFVRGSFSLHSLNVTAPVLFFYSIGLFFFCGIKLLVNSFYSLKDTVTPAKTATVALFLNAGLSAFLIFPLKIGGVALASSLAGIFNFFSLYKLLIKRIGKINWTDTFQQLVKLCILGVVSGLVFKLVWLYLNYNKYIKLLAGILIYISVFWFIGNLLRVKQIQYFRRWILKEN